MSDFVIELRDADSGRGGPAPPPSPQLPASVTSQAIQAAAAVTQATQAAARAAVAAPVVPASSQAMPRPGTQNPAPAQPGGPPPPPIPPYQMPASPSPATPSAPPPVAAPKPTPGTTFDPRAGARQEMLDEAYRRQVRDAREAIDPYRKHERMAGESAEREKALRERLGQGSPRAGQAAGAPAGGWGAARGAALGMAAESAKAAASRGADAVTSMDPRALRDAGGEAAKTGAILGGAAIGAIAGPKGMIAGAIIGEKAGEAFKKVLGFYDNLSKVADRFSQYNGELAGAKANAEVIELLGDIRRSNVLGADLAKLTEANTRASQEAQDLLMNALRPMLPIFTALSERVGDILKLIKWIGEAEAAPQDDVIENMNAELGMAFQRLVDRTNDRLRRPQLPGRDGFPRNPLGVP